MRATPYTSLCFIFSYKQSSGDNRVALDMEHAASFFIATITLVARASTSIYNCTFHLGNTIVAATNNLPSAVKPYFCHKPTSPTYSYFYSFIFNFPIIFMNHGNICATVQTICMAVPQFSRLVTVQARVQTHGTHLKRYFCPLKDGNKTE